LKEQRKPYLKEVVPFYPNHLVTEVAVALAVLGAIFLLAGLFPGELGPPANMVMTPSHIAPEWYFLWIFGLLKILPQFLGLMIPVLLFLAVLLLPWLDRSNYLKAKGSPWVIISTEVLLIILVILTYVGLE